MSPPLTHDSATAALIGLPAGPPEVPDVLGDAFWSPELSEQDRTLTLLHEAIHLHLEDTKPDRTVRSEVLRRRLSEVKRTGFIGGLILREDGAHVPKEQVRPGAA